MILLLLACIPSPTDLPTSDWQVDPALLPPHNLGSTGSDLHAAGDVNGDGYDDILVGDCSTHTVSLYNGGTTGVSSSPAWQDSGSYACTLAAVGDVNGDGYADFMVGDPSDSSSAGTVSLYVGGSNGPTFRQSWTGAPGEQLGTGLFGLGDLNGDGYDDLGISAWIQEDATTDGLDRLDVHYGAASGPATAADWTWQHQTTAGSSLFPNAGLGVTGLDMDGNGTMDLAIAGTWDDGSGNSNTVAFFSGGTSGLSSTASTTLRAWIAESRVELLAADLDGAGRDVLLVVADDFVYRQEGSAFGALHDLAGLVSSVHTVDVDGNGRDELAMTMPNSWSYGQPSSYMLAIHQDGTTKPWLGSSAGSVLVPLGDVNGDGSLDAAIWDGTLKLWYGSQDTDGDGFDTDGSSTFGQDCNDQDATIHPGSVETAGDGVDSDCDGLDAVTADAATCVSFSTPAEAKQLLNPDNLPLPDFSRLEGLADACGSTDVATPATLCDAMNQNCRSAGGTWVRSACTEAADGVDADGLSWSRSEGSSYFDGITAEEESESRQLRALQVAVDPSSGADPYAGTEVDVQGTVSSSFTDDVGSWYSQWSSSSRSHRLAHGVARRQNGRTEDYRLSYVHAENSEGMGVWGWWGANSIDTSSVDMDFQQGSCTLSGSLSSRTDAWGGFLAGHDYVAVVTDGVHTVKVQNGANLEVCGQNFWTLVGGGYWMEQDSYGWADLDGVGQVVNLSTWEAAPGDNDGDGWPRRMGDCDDSNSAINPCAVDSAGVDHNCDGQVSAAPAVDQDGDGEPAGVDCNDLDATIFSGATEGVADDVDSNCDGQELCYADSDQDGHGDANAMQLSTDSDCLDAGESYGDDDCKDSDPMVHPGSFEAPGNGVDDDCDGVES